MAGVEEIMVGRIRLKLKGKQLKELREKIAMVNYAVENALQSSFLPQEVFEMLDAARDSGEDIERALMP
jgi:hypothetical protein